MVKLVNRAKVTTTTTGTGTITLGDAQTGYQDFAVAGLADGEVVSYVIEDGAEWEIGSGTYSASGTTLTRSVSESSAGGAAISLSGNAAVFATAIASDLQNAADMDQGVATTDSPSFAAITVNGNVTVTGTVDGRDVAADGSKLDGIEAGADVTDTDNVTAAGALMDSELTSIAAVKALDQGVATTDSPSFAGGTFAGDLTIADKIIHDGDTNTAIRFPAVDTVTVETGGVERARITTFFQLNSPTAAEVRLRNTTSLSNGRVYYDTTNSMVFDAGAVHKFFTNGSEALRVTPTGNVGINESAPDYRLDVNGAIGFTPGASVTPVDNGDVVFELTNNTTLTIKAKGSDGVVRSGTVTLA